MSIGNGQRNIGGKKTIFKSGPFSGGGGSPPVNTVAPVLSGLNFVGQTLTSTTGTWTGTPPISYSYVFISTMDFINFTVVQSSASPTYVVQAVDAGKSIRCNVNASNSFGNDASSSNYIAIKSTILDLYNTNVERCYYLTLQRGAYYGSPCIRVRRSGDNSETNIGFDTSGNLDTANLTAFVIAGGGTQNGFIVTYYDQSTNARNATQGNNSKQAQIVASGAIMTNGGLTITDYTVSGATGDYTVTAQALNAYTIYHYNQLTSLGSTARAITGQSSIWPIYHAQVGDGFRDSGGYETIINPASSAFVKRAYVRNSNNGELYYNGVSQGTKTTLDTGTNSFNSYMGSGFGTFTNDKLRGTIVYTTNHNAATVSAISNLLD
jgi:hypothetical protein